MDIESVTRIIETREDIREAVVVAMGVGEVGEGIVEIPAEIIVKIMVKVIIKVIMVRATVRITIISSRSIPAKEIPTEATIEAAETIIRTGGKVEEDGEAEFKVDGIKVPIIPVRIVINAAVTTEAEADNTEDATLRIFLMLVNVSHEEKKRKLILK